jgi:hypothetical protein
MNHRLLLIFAMFILLLSCSASRMTETVLYFGQSRPNGSLITEKEWNNFKETYISKVFNEGYSIIRVEGSWTDTVTNTLITEPTYQVIYFYQKSSDVSQQIDSLRYYYQTLFQQQAILRVDKNVKASF